MTELWQAIGDLIAQHGLPITISIIAVVAAGWLIKRLLDRVFKQADKAYGKLDEIEQNTSQNGKEVSELSSKIESLVEKQDEQARRHEKIMNRLPSDNTLESLNRTLQQSQKLNSQMFQILVGQRADEIDANIDSESGGKPPRPQA